MVTRITSPLVAVSVQREHHDCVTRAAFPFAAVTFMDIGELAAFLENRRAAAAFFIALSVDMPHLVAKAIRIVRDARPATPIIACATLHSESTHLMVRAVRAGADHVTLQRFDDLERAMRTVLGVALASPISAETLHRALPWIPPGAHGTVAYCIMNATHRPTVATVADALRVSERSLHRLLGTLALPTPESTINWCRLLVAAHMMTLGGQSIERVAGTLGFGTGSGLRSMLRRYTELRVTDLRGPDAVERLAQLYCVSRHPGTPSQERQGDGANAGNRAGREGESSTVRGCAR
jgi:AraC-like DNA-binding protein